MINFELMMTFIYATIIVTLELNCLHLLRLTKLINMTPTPVETALNSEYKCSKHCE